LRIGITEDPPTEGDKLFVLLTLCKDFGHLAIGCVSRRGRRLELIW
jgi:hypothetical protein